MTSYTREHLKPEVRGEDSLVISEKERTIYTFMRLAKDSKSIKRFLDDPNLTTLRHYEGMDSKVLDKDKIIERLERREIEVDFLDDLLLNEETKKSRGPKTL